jgi:hypothetical protein
MQGRSQGADALTAHISGFEVPRLAVRRDLMTLIGFLSFHVLLGVILPLESAVATLHAMFVCALAVWAVLRWSTVRIAFLAAYVAGCDVLWRMTEAHVPWEISKYLIALLCVGGILRLRGKARWNLAALVYFVALLPAIARLLDKFTGDHRLLIQQLSFNLSGPLCLFASAWYLSQIRLTRRELRVWMVNFIGPALTIAVITLVSTHTATNLNFTDESSLVTSGGFGPNQVSAILGLAAMLSLLAAVDWEITSSERWLAFALVLLFSVQSAMTFSRGGLYNFAIAFLPAAFLFSLHRRSKKWLVRITILLTLTATVLIFPRLDTFTGGALKDRFADTDPGGRSTIIQEDFRLWGEHPILGLGPGSARQERRGEFRIAHTEYTRMLSEHGLFGLVALAALFYLALTQALRHEPTQGKAVRIAFIVWSMAAMLHVGMRLAAVGLLFGLGCARSFLAKEPSHAPPAKPY